MGEGGGPVTLAEWGNHFSAKAMDISTFLLLKLNTLLSTIVGQVEDNNGFELWRMVNREEDPIRHNAKFQLEVDVRGLGQRKCASFHDTIKLLQVVERRAKEFREKTGEALEGSLMKEVMWGAMDEDTMDIAELAKHDEETSTCKEFKGLFVAQI